MNSEQNNLNTTQENNMPKFDPMTGQPINNAQNVNTVNQNVQTTNGFEQNIANNESAVVQSQMQSIPTVEQNNEQFINNVQANNNENTGEVNSKKNLLFLIILFVVILVAIIFLFPYLSKFI